MAKGKKKVEAPSEVVRVMDLELQNAVIALLESGSDDGCDGTVVVNVEEFRKVQELLIDRTGETYGSLSEDNVSNTGDTEDEEEEETDDDDDDFDDEPEEDDDFEAEDGDWDDE